MQPTTRGYSNTIPPPFSAYHFCFAENDDRKRKSPTPTLYLSSSDSQSQCRTNTRGIRNSKEENAGVRRLPLTSCYAATSPAPDPPASAPPGRPASRPAAPGCGFSRPRVRGPVFRVRGFWMKSWWLRMNGGPRWDPGDEWFSLGGRG